MNYEYEVRKYYKNNVVIFSKTFALYCYRNAKNAYKKIPYM